MLDGPGNIHPTPAAGSHSPARIDPNKPDPAAINAAVASVMASFPARS